MSPDPAGELDAAAAAAAKANAGADMNTDTNSNTNADTNVSADRNADADASTSAGTGTSTTTTTSTSTSASTSTSTSAASESAGVESGAGGALDPETKHLLAALKGPVLAHNRGSLAGALIGYTLAVSSVIGAGVMVFGSRWIAGLLLGFALIAARRALAFHRHVIYDGGPGRLAAARLWGALLERGGKAPLDEVTEALGQQALLDGLEVLGRMGAVYAAAEDGVDRLYLDPDRLADPSGSPPQPSRDR